MDVEPTGVIRVVPPDALVFSTTDARGVITGANSVFCRTVRRTEDDLLRRPHNVIRHPDMPAGVFTLMWEVLDAGRPMAGYVLNLAADGAAYWVFATITPLDGGYLSVRQGPMAGDLWRRVDELYHAVRPLEVAARARGASRAQAARLGAQALVDGLRDLGFESYESFQDYALPVELSTRRAVHDWKGPDRRDGLDPALDALVGEVCRVDDVLVGQLSDLDELGRLVELLDSARSQLEPVLNGLYGAARGAAEASSQLIGALPALRTMAEGLLSDPDESTTALTSTREELAQVRSATANLRFVSALARLHAETVAQFAREIAAGDASPNAPSSIRGLRRALQLTAEELSASSALATERLRAAAALARDLEQHLRSMQKSLATWRLLVLRHGRSRGAGADTVAVDDQLRASLHQADQLRELAERCLRAARPLDVETLAAAVAEVAEAARARETSRP